MDVSPNKTQPRSSEMRAVVSDFVAKYKSDLVSAFRARRNPSLGNHVPLKDFGWLFFDFFARESGLKFLRKDETGADLELTRDNSQEFFLEQLQAFFFDYLRIDGQLHADRLEVPISFDFFWTVLFHLIEAKQLGYQYLKPGALSTSDTRDSLRKTTHHQLPTAANREARRTAAQGRKQAQRNRRQLEKSAERNLHLLREAAEGGQGRRHLRQLQRRPQVAERRRVAAFLQRLRPEPAALAEALREHGREREAREAAQRSQHSGRPA